MDQTTFSNIIHYHAYAAAAYADDCPTPPWGSSIVQQFNDLGTDTQATLFYDSSKNEVIISFRGSSSPTDFNNDFDFLMTNAALSGGFSCNGCQVGYLKPLGGVS